MLDALTLDQMRAFIAVVESGSFRAAAGRLSRVQSAISHAVATMETELGLKLFDRSGHRPALTPEGQALLPDVRAILMKSDCLRARARGLSEGVELSLSVVVDTLFPIATAATVLREMHEAYPTVGVSLRVAPLGGPLAALEEQRASLGIVVGEIFRNPRIDVEALSSVCLQAVASPSHPLAARARSEKPVGTVELTDHLQIVVEDPTPMTEGYDIGVLSPGTWRVGSQETKYALILAGLGWGRLPRWLIERDLAEGRLVRLKASALGQKGAAALPTYLARRLDMPFGPAARAFRQALLQHTGSAKRAAAGRPDYGRDHATAAPAA